MLRQITWSVWLLGLIATLGLHCTSPLPPQEVSHGETAHKETLQEESNPKTEVQTTLDATMPPERIVPSERIVPPEGVIPPERVAPPEPPTPKDEAGNDAQTPVGWVHPATPYVGKATWYEADGSGNCSFPKQAAPVMVAAMNESQYATAALCGACLQVKGPTGNTIVVTVVDRCPECKPNHLDLSKAAFSKLADLKTGVIAIQWQMVPCAAKQPMQYFYKDGSSQWWTAVQIRRHRIPITKVEVQKNGAWVELARQQYNFFLDSKGFGNQPRRIRIHALNGETREETLPAPTSSKLVTGTQQF